MRKKLAKLDCQIVNARMSASLVSNFKTDSSYTVFLRYFADFVEEDKALYLDCDIVVTRDLRPYLKQNLEMHHLLLSRIWVGKCIFISIFNAGFLLINNALWKQENIRERFIELTNEWHDKVPSGDQAFSICSLKTAGWSCLLLTTALRCTTFSDYEPEKGLYPPVIHYLTERKPWKRVCPVHLS